MDGPASKESQLPSAADDPDAFRFYVARRVSNPSTARFLFATGIECSYPLIAGDISLYATPIHHASEVASAPASRRVKWILRPRRFHTASNGLESNGSFPPFADSQSSAAAGTKQLRLGSFPIVQPTNGARVRWM
jgi:hypothetical protein